jgi:hypothetical protein
MQKILGYSALRAGLGILLMMGVFACVSAVAGPLYARLRTKVVVSAGALCLPVGAFLISLVDSHSEWLSLVPGMVVPGVGVGLFYSSVTTAGVTAVDESRASLAGGIVYMFQIAGGSIGLALTTTVFQTASQDRLQADPLTGPLGPTGRQAVQGVLAGTDSAKQVVTHLAAAPADRIVEVVRQAFAAGMEWAFRFVAVLAVFGFLVTVLFVGGALVARRATARHVG